MSAREWRCFHCDEVFTDEAAARAHFGSYGPRIISEPACQIDAAEYRAMEQRMADYNAEDAAIHRQMAGMEHEHKTALRREEERGYARGLETATAALATLDRLGYTYTQGAELWKPPIGPNPFEPGGRYHAESALRERATRMLASLHETGILSEQQCAKVLGIDLIALREAIAEIEAARPPFVPAPAPAPGAVGYTVILPRGDRVSLPASAADYADDGCEDAWQKMRAAAARRAACWCETCRPVASGNPLDMRMVTCPDCGNKRCPKAFNHENGCTKSNDVGQVGSSWEHGTLPPGEKRETFGYKVAKTEPACVHPEGCTRCNWCGFRAEAGA